MKWPLLLLLAGPRPFCRPAIDPGIAVARVAEQPVALHLQTDDTAQRVHFVAMVRAGSAYDPVGLEGLAAITARSALSAHTGSSSGTSLLQQLAKVEGLPQVQVGRELVSLSLSCPNRHTVRCAELFSEWLTHPRDDSAAIASLADDTAHYLAHGQSPSAIALAALESWLFEGHPYGHDPAGRWSVLPLVNPAQVTHFYQRHYVRAAVSVGVTGKTPSEAHEALVERLARLPTRLPAPLVLQRPIAVEQPQLLVIDTPSSRAEIWLGQTHTLTPDSADWPALLVGSVAFAQRQPHDPQHHRAIWAQPVSTQADPLSPDPTSLRRAPSLSLHISAPTGTGPSALISAVEDYQTLASEGITDAELQAATAIIHRHLDSRGPALRQRHELAHRALFSTATALTPAIDALTTERVNDVLRSYLQPSALKMTVATDSAMAFAAALAEDLDTNSVQDPAPLSLPADRIYLVPSQGLFR